MKDDRISDLSHFDEQVKEPLTFSEMSTLKYSIKNYRMDYHESKYRIVYFPEDEQLTCDPGNFSPP